MSERLDRKEDSNPYNYVELEKKEPNKPTRNTNLEGSLTKKQGKQSTSPDKGPVTYDYVGLGKKESDKLTKGVDFERGLADRQSKRSTPLDKGPVEPMERPKDIGSVAKMVKNQVVETVASTLINSAIHNSQQRETLKDAIRTRMGEREKKNKVTDVVMYDKKAPSKLPHQERPNPVIEHDRERTR